MLPCQSPKNTPENTPQGTAIFRTYWTARQELDCVKNKKIYQQYIEQNIKKYKTMVGINDFGETAYLYKFKQITIQADKVNEFWSTTQDDAYNKYIIKLMHLNKKMKFKTIQKVCY